MGDLKVSRNKTSNKFHIVMAHRPDFSKGKIDADLLVAGHLPRRTGADTILRSSSDGFQCAEVMGQWRLGKAAVRKQSFNFTRCRNGEAKCAEAAILLPSTTYLCGPDAG